MNDWLIVFIFSIVAYSISNHFVYAHGPMHIYDHIRCIAEKIHPNLGELFSCMICFPSWVGIFLSLINYFFIPERNLTPGMIIMGDICPWWVIMLVDLFFASGIVWLIHTLQEHFERREENEPD